MDSGREIKMTSFTSEQYEELKRYMKENYNFTPENMNSKCKESKRKLLQKIG